MTSIERTAYPRFKRLITAHELHLFFSPTRDEVAWVSEVTDCDEHLLALLLMLMLMLKSYQRMGCFRGWRTSRRWWWTSCGGRWSCWRSPPWTRWARLLRLPEERDTDGTTQYNRLTKFAQSPTWSHFNRLIAQLEWLDALGDTGAWMEGVAPRNCIR
ncbi:hypothetical protein [Streptomyces oryzae]|uniref:hypothetical protein n=1 Tax=Streptomyces oryzae TaxID=1434886 RepID=UPI001FFDFF7A|nr:hypothetical protein [Streptomyces oryzae]